MILKIDLRNLGSDVKSTTSGGRAFQTLTTLSLKKFFLMLVSGRLLYNLYTCPSVWVFIYLFENFTVEQNAN